MQGFVAVPGKTWITPPMASLPYIAEAGPRMISMRSIWATGRRDQVGSPEVADPTRMPSTSSRTCLALVPRMSSNELVPQLPLVTSWIPGWAARICSRLLCPAVSISLRSMTLMSLSTSLTRSGWRVAVTTMVSRLASCSAAWSGLAKASGSSNASRVCR